MFDNFDWSDAAQVALLLGAITSIITALGKVAVDIITAALDRNTEAVHDQTIKSQAADTLKLEAMQRTLEATPGTEAITRTNLPASPRLQDPEIRQEAVKLLTPLAPTPEPSRSEYDGNLRELIREELLKMVNEERSTSGRPSPIV